MSQALQLTNATVQIIIDQLQETANTANMATYANYSKAVVDVLDENSSFSNHEKKFVYRANNYIKQYLV